MGRICLNGDDWLIKEFVGLDWVWRDSVKMETADVRWWMPATVPGSVMEDLRLAKKVPDPYYGLNSKLVEWVSERTWVYRKKFTWHESLGERALLCFDGIDYSAEIYLNGEFLGHHEGMFVRFEADVTDKLMQGDNLLAVVLEAAPKEQPQVGRTSKVYTHKSRMTYWWDFCPRMVHQGIWDSVYIHTVGTARLEDVYVRSTWKPSSGSAVVTVEARVDGKSAHSMAVSFGEHATKSTVLGDKALVQIAISNPELWYPNGYGSQYVYDVSVRLYDRQGAMLDEKCLRHGIRLLEWKENEGAHTTQPPYTLYVNDRRIYIKGVNWVPMDVLYGVSRPQKLRRLLRLAKRAGINMLRVWGGGLIERDDFYEICAEEGLLVWQEFIQSSSGIDNKTSSDPVFLKEMMMQAEHIIKRKRNHTALAVWCGGNELQDDNGMPLDNSDPVLMGLGGVVKKLDVDRRWLPTSPYGGYFLNSIENIEKVPDQLADVHGPWEHQGFEKHCALYNKGISLVSTEFGVEGFAHLSTLQKTMDENVLWPPTKDNEVYFHRGAWWNNAPLVQEMYGGIDDLGMFVKASQYLQFEGLRYSLESNIRRRPRHSASFPWQFNEPYPNASCTSLLDYYTAPKAGYYAMQSAYRDVYPSASFRSQRLQDGVLRCDLWVCGAGARQDSSFTYEWELFDNGGVLLEKDEISVEYDQDVKRVSNIHVANLAKGLYLLRLALVAEGVRTENEYMFVVGDDYNNLLQSPQTRLVMEKREKILRVVNKGNAIAWWVLVQADIGAAPEGFFANNYLCLLPGEAREIISDMPDGAEISAEGFNCSL